MPAADELAAFAVTAFVIIMIPGPSVLFIVARALAHGPAAGVWITLLAVLGFLGGYGLLRAPPRRPVVPRQDEI
jgi:threonine/homoserine/homoserine lactone efflux protein